MTQQLELEFQKRGKRVSAEVHNQHLQTARRLAHELASDGSVICIDHVHDLAKARGIDLPSGNYLGSTFDEKFWDPVSVTKAWHERSNARLIRTWKLKQRSEYGE